MRILIVRLSSMGDMVHTLPALTDAARALPDIEFDWAVDEAFSQIPAWHRNVRKVIPCPPRRGIRELRRSYGNRTLQNFFKALRSEKYDLVIDVQTELKSAVVTRLARGIRCGYDSNSVHEFGAQLAYQRKYFVPKKLHSILRMRRLLALCLAYEFDATETDYGIDRSKLQPVPGFTLPVRYVVLIHSTSWQSKNWPEEYWRTLTQKIIAAGYSIVLPWGSEQERERSVRIAANHPAATVLQKMTISEKAWVLSRAAAAIGCDTGLSHIAAALDIPSVTLYGPTDPEMIGATGKNQIHVVSSFRCTCKRGTCTNSEARPDKPACMSLILPDEVFSALTNIHGI